MYRNFEELTAALKERPQHRLAVAAAQDEPVLQAVVRAKEENIADAILVGNRAEIEALLRGMNRDPGMFRMVEVPREQAGEAAVDLIKQGEADILVKGLLETREFLGPVVRRENNLRTGRIMSIITLLQVPGYHKLIGVTDGGMVIAPTLEEKASITENAAQVMLALGYEQPKIAVLAGIEKVNPKMPVTVDADELRRRNQEDGWLPDCVVEGPISYDVAMSAEIAHHKGYPGEHCGNFDLLVVPTLESGNFLTKSWTVTAGACMAGIVTGAKIPIVLPSRGSSAQEKFLSIALAVLVAS